MQYANNLAKVQVCRVFHMRGLNQPKSKSAWSGDAKYDVPLLTGK